MEEYVSALNKQKSLLLKVQQDNNRLTNELQDKTLALKDLTEKLERAKEDSNARQEFESVSRALTEAEAQY